MNAVVVLSPLAEDDLVAIWCTVAADDIRAADKLVDELLERLQSLGPSSLRGLARSLERDVKRVHEDVAALIQVGLIEKTEHGRIHVPFEVIEADFELRAA